MAAVEGRFHAAPEVPAHARQLVRSLGLDDSTRSTVELVVSELVTNAVVHGDQGRGGDLLVALRCDGQLIRGEICSEGDAFDWDRHEPDLEEPGGLGLMVVDQIADRWGIEQNSTSCVWFECPGCV